jgi:single-strand DNA-binding protein
MSDGLNRVVLLGRLGADPELRVATGGLSILCIRLATNETFLDKNKDPQSRTEWHDVVVFGPRADALVKLLAKGDGLLVEGSLRTHSYEKDGVKRWRTEVIARDVCFAGKARSAPEEESLRSKPRRDRASVTENELPF